MAGAHSFGRYRVTGTLGSGAMGDVFAAVDEVLGREVAVKTLKGGATGLAARMLDERFKLEARAIAALSHPGIVQVFDIDLSAEPPYLVMERVAGPSLKDQLANGPLSNSEVRALGIQIANALAAAHAAKILHRDVKPANILAAGPGRWKLADFGVAHVPDSSLTMTGQFVGSPAYAPPEALVRGQSGAEGDVFGLGATLFQAAAGTWPRAEATSGGLLAPVPPVRSLAPNIPEEVASAIDRACAIEPADRPSAAELADLLASGVSRPSMQAAVPVGVAAIASDRISAPNLATAPGGRASAPVLATEFVGDESRPGFAATPLATVGLPEQPRPQRRMPWKPIAIGGGVLGVLIIIALVNSPGKGQAGQVGTSAASPLSVQPGGAAANQGAADDRAEPVSSPEPAGDGRIQSSPPELTSPEEVEAWNDIATRINHGDLGGARRSIDEFERDFGSRPELDRLKKQLDPYVRQVEPRGRGRGKKKFKD